MRNLRVVSYRNSTSNHNRHGDGSRRAALYLIEILHQTTTQQKYALEQMRLYLIEILHQTTTRIVSLCIERLLYLIEILHQTTTNRPCCRRSGPLYLIEILHQTTTIRFIVTFVLLLYLIEILHQTTTYIGLLIENNLLYLIEILHQTTTPGPDYRKRYSCILSKFYIKPQLPTWPPCRVAVVSYRNSTSNHNDQGCRCDVIGVVSYRNSTSNHNSPTLNIIFWELYLIEILHQTTTPAVVTNNL